MEELLKEANKQILALKDEFKRKKMFDLFSKKEKEPKQLLNWEKPKTLDAAFQIDMFARERIIELLKEISDKAEIKNVDSETLDGIYGWVSPETRTGYELIIYCLTDIIDRLARIEKLVHSKNKSSKSD